jgi:alkylation response protein AidB-like acyl-CoA dehydrogenase
LPASRNGYDARPRSRYSCSSNRTADRLLNGQAPLDLQLLRARATQSTRSPAADELAIQAKIYGSETAVRVITDLMLVVGVDSCDHEAPLGRLLQDALALPIFDGGNMGVRRRQLHTMLKRPDYEPLLASGAA